MQLRKNIYWPVILVSNYIMCGWCIYQIHLLLLSPKVPVRNYLSEEDLVWFKILDDSIHKGEEGRAEKCTLGTNGEERNKTK